MRRVIVIDESKETKMMNAILKSPFTPKADQVIAIQEYLDKNFVKQKLDTLDTNGYPTKENVVILVSSDKQPLKTLNMKELLMLLDDKFHKFISDDKDRRMFLKQVIIDWYKGNIRNGILSVNHF